MTKMIIITLIKRRQKSKKTKFKSKANKTDRASAKCIWFLLKKKLRHVSRD